MTLPQTDKSIVITTPSGERVVFWQPFPKQVEFHESTIPNLLARGSRFSGKSVMLRHDAHMRAMSVPGVNLALVRRTLKDLHKTHLIDIRKEMQQLGGTYHGTEYVATYPTGSRLFFTYLGHESHDLNVLGAELLGLYVDELSTIPWESFMKFQASVRTTRRGVQAVTRAGTNPFGESAAEVEAYFVRRDVDPSRDPDYDPGDWGYIQINMEDNPYADLEAYRKRLTSLPPNLRRAWLFGEFSDEEALFEFQPTRNGQPWHVVRDLDLDRLVASATIYRAFDFGWSPDPSYCLWIAHLGNRYVAFHEKVWYKTTIAAIARDIHAEDSLLGVSRVAMTFCDPTLGVHTGADIRSNKDILEAEGIPVECSINNRTLFATAIHAALATEAQPSVPLLHIYANGEAGCPYLVRALPLMRADAGNPMAMRPHKHDHPVVCLAYFLISSASSPYDRARPKRMPRWMRPKDSDLWVLGRYNVR